MRIHHLNCGTFCPPARRLINGDGGLESARLTCHCLLIESRDGLVLVDTGLGLKDLADPPGRIGPLWSLAMRPQPRPEDSAIRQIGALGFDAADVRHIVLTHLDFDHAGGLPDFPRAEVHVYEDEYEAAMARRTWLERFRYKPPHWAHGPDWVRYSLDGDDWFGFAGVRALYDAETEILLIPLVGHTRGHCGIAVRDERGWLLHAGDAYFHHEELVDPLRRCPPGAKLYERIMQTDRRARVANQQRLAALGRRQGDWVRIICSHDRDEYDACVQAQAPARVEAPL